MLEGGAHTSPISVPRVTLTLASEPNLVSFYWRKGCWAGGPLLGPDLGGLVTIPDESAPVSSLFNPTRTVVNTLRDQTPQPRGLKKSVVPAVGLLVGETVTYFGNQLSSSVFLLACACIFAVAAASRAAA